MKEKLFKYLGKKHQVKVMDLQAEDGLIEDCKYMLYFNPNYGFNGYDSVPCKNIDEAIYYSRNATMIHEDLYLYIQDKCLRGFKVYLGRELIFIGNGSHIINTVSMEFLQRFKIEEIYFNGEGETITCKFQQK